MSSLSRALVDVPVNSSPITMKFVLLDPGLLNTHGHHFHTDLVIYNELQARGIETLVLGNRLVETAICSAMPVEPVFRSPAYPKRDGVDQGDLEANFRHFNRLVAEDLKTAGLESFSADDIILIPTARDIHLSGIFDWYTRLPFPRPRICIRLMFLPWFRNKPEERELAIQLSKDQLQNWTGIPESKLILASESRELAQYYQTLCGVSPIVFPLIVRYPVSKNTGISLRKPESPKHFVFLGEARKEKGAHLIPEAFETLLKKFPDLKLTVQTSCLYDIEKEFVNQLIGLSPGVSLQTEALHEENYDKCLNSADVVLIPYKPESYQRRTSLIFLEAVGAGIPVLPTAGTWMCAEMKRLGLNGIFIEEFTSQSIAAAVENVIKQWPEVIFNALKAKKTIKAKHNPIHFVDELLKRCNGRAPITGNRK